MKTMKTLFSSLLFLLAVCSSALAGHSNTTQLPVYQNALEDIALAYDQALLSGTVKLDNGLTFRIVDYKTRDDNIMKKWHRGEVIHFHPYIKGDTLVLAAKNLKKLSDVEPYLIFDAIKSPNTGLKIVEINDEGKFIKLNDNSVWDFSWYHRFSTEKWKVGERVMVFGKGDHNSYEFINLDTPVRENAYSAMGSFVVR